MGTRIAAALIVLTSGSLSWAIFNAPIEAVPRPMPTVVRPAVPAAEATRSSDVESAAETVAEREAAPAPGSEPPVEAPVEPSVESKSAFDSPTLWEAKDAFAQKRYVAARALLQKSGLVDPPARFLAALSAYRDRQWQVAASEFEGLAPDYSVLADLCRTYAGRAHLEARAFTAATAVLSEVGADSPHFKDARIALARAWAGLDQHRKALAALEPFLAEESAQDASVRAWFLEWGSELALKARDVKRARRLQLELWSRYPTTSHARKIASKLPSHAVTPAARAVRADALADANRHADARKEAARVLRTHPFPNPAGCHARFVQGKILRKERRHAEAIASLEPVARRCRGADLRVRTLYVLGSSQSIVAPESGRRTYERLAREFPEHSFADDALYYAADLDVQLGEPKEALARLGTVTIEHPTSDFAPEAAFRIFWHHWRQGDLAAAESAASAFEALTRAEGLEAQRARARYWQARLLQKQGHTDQAVALFEDVWREHPATLYARWARQRWTDATPADAQTAPRAPAVTAKRAELGALASDPRFLAATELSRLGLSEGDALYLGIDFDAYPAESAVALFHLLQQAGQHSVAAQLPEAKLSSALYGPLDETSRPIWKVHRPDTFEELLGRAAAAANVPPHLFQALVRRESRFSPRARSGAGAIGLAQLMPVTARATARSLGFKLRSTEQLTQPALNARLGATYLGQLLRRFEAAELAVAAYNGGPTRVERWWAERSSDELDEFVENIPIAETRAYVKNVLGDYAAYERLDGDRVVATRGEGGASGG